MKRLAAFLIFFLWAQLAGAQWLPLGTPGPGVWLDFGSNVGCVSATSCLLNSTAVSLVTTTRATTNGTATCPDSAGNYTQFGNNTTRWGAGAGACIEEARTNGVRNDSNQGAVIGSPGTPPTNWSCSYTANQGTLACNISALATESGIDYVDVQLTGTPAGAGDMQLAFEGGGIISASTGQAWSESAFITQTGGTNANLTYALRINERAGGFLASNTSATFVPTAASLGANRRTYTVTLGNASTTNIVPFVIYTYAAAVATNVTLRIGWPQLELGASVSTPIRTTAAAGVRGADLTTVTTPPTFGAAITGYGKASPFAPTGYGTIQWVFAIGQGNNNERIGVRRTAAGLMQGVVTVGGSNVYNQSGASWAQNTIGKAAITSAAGDQEATFNGTLLTAGTGAMPSTATAMYIGSDPTGALQCNCQILQAGAWTPYRMPNAALQTQTTLP